MTVLAIDAGNSKTDVAVVAADGTVVGTARGGGFQPHRANVEPAVDVLAEAVDRAFAQVGVDTVDHVSACLANADLPVEERELAKALTERRWGSRVDVRNDTFAVLRAGLLEDAEPRGVAVVCGAGVNCAGMLPDGRTARFPAIGRLSGDWGGGGGLAEEAIWFAARAEDGRGEPTALMHALPAHFGLDSMYALIEALHLGHIPAARRHELTPSSSPRRPTTTRWPAPWSSGWPTRWCRWQRWPSAASTSWRNRPRSSWAAASWQPNTPNSTTA